MPVGNTHTHDREGEGGAVLTPDSVNGRPLRTESSQTITVSNYASLQDALNQIPVVVAHPVTVDVDQDSLGSAQVPPVVMRRLDPNNQSSGVGLTITGDTATPTNRTVTHLTVGPATAEGGVRVEGLELSSTDFSRSAGLLFAGTGKADVGDCTFSAPAGDNVTDAIEVRGEMHLSMDTGLTISGEYSHMLKAKGGATAHEQSNSGSGVWTNNGTINNGGVNAQNGSYVQVESGQALESAGFVTVDGFVMTVDHDVTGDPKHFQAIDGIQNGFTVQPNTTQPGSGSDPALELGDSGAGFFVNGSGEVVVVDEAGNTTTLS